MFEGWSACFSVAIEMRIMGLRRAIFFPYGGRRWGWWGAELSSGTSVGDRRGLQLALASALFASVRAAFFTSRRQIGNLPRSDQFLDVPLPSPF